MIPANATSASKGYLCEATNPALKKHFAQQNGFFVNNKFTVMIIDYQLFITLGY